MKTAPRFTLSDWSLRTIWSPIWAVTDVTGGKHSATAGIDISRLCWLQFGFNGIEPLDDELQASVGVFVDLIHYELGI